MEVTGTGLLVEPPELADVLEVPGEEYITTGGALVGRVPPAMFTTRKVGEGTAVGALLVGVCVAVCSATTGTTTWGGRLSLALACFCLLRSCTVLLAKRLHSHTVPVRAPDARNNFTEVALFFLFSMDSSDKGV